MRFGHRTELHGQALFLAGDWTATGWPATMEGAVRSGYGAAEALARPAGGENGKFRRPGFACGRDDEDI